MRKKSALILIQWSLGQVKHCVHVTFIQVNGQLQCALMVNLSTCVVNGFYSCENVGSHQFLTQLCYTTVVSWSLIQWHCLLSCLVAWSRGSEVEKPNSRLEVRCLVSYRERFDVFFLAKPNHRRNIPISTILLCQPFWSFWSGRKSEETLLACVCRRRCSYVIRPKTAFILFFKSEEISLHTEVRGPQNPS